MVELERPIYSLDFLDLHFDIHSINKKTSLDSKKYQLPNVSDYIETEKFCKVFVGWSSDAMHFQFVSSRGFGNGDKIHLGIDTRDLKSALILHRFCHLFEANVQDKGHLFFEKTRFRRPDDAHELCSSSLLKIEKEEGIRKQSIRLEIPKNCLHGFDPNRFDRLGFFYVVEKKMGARQDFCMSYQVWNVFDAPGLWQTLHLK